MKSKDLAARMLQIDGQLARMDERRRQHDELITKLPKDDPSRGKLEEEKNNGLAEIVELLNERTRLAFITDPSEASRLTPKALKPLITQDLKASTQAIIADFETKFGKATAASCSIARCVQCVMCPASCAGACQNCVHCPPNGVIHRP